MFRPPPLPRTLEAALRDLGEARPAVRASAAADLAKRADEDRPKVLEGLVRALDDDAPDVRGQAALALADIGATEALDHLVELTLDRDVSVRQMAITALGELRDPRATDRLREALRDDRAEVRFQATMAFPRVASSIDDAIEALLAASRDDDPEVCRIALRMAEELGDPEDEDAAVPARLLERAKAMLRHDSPKVALAAAVVVAREGLSGGHTILAKAARAELEGADPEDVAAAIELCGELRIEKARVGLERRAFGGLLGINRDPFAWHSRVALAQMKHERAVREILADLTGWGFHRRTLAVAAVGRAGLIEAKPILQEMADRPARADPGAVASALRALDDHEAAAKSANAR